MHSGPLPAPAQLGEYEAVYPGSAKWIFDQAEKNAEHVRTMERRGMELQGRDALLHRLLPFGGVLAFLVASAIIAFASPAAGAAGLFTTMAGVLYAYLTGRTPPSSPPPPS
jgi:uncharacterized membrane protein